MNRVNLFVCGSKINGQKGIEIRNLLINKKKESVSVFILKDKFFSSIRILCF